MILWITSFNEKLYEVSGQFLLKSKEVTETEGDWFIGHEKFGGFALVMHKFSGFDLDCSQFLKLWLNRNKHIIPKALGGTGKVCKCPKPFLKSAKDHKKGCHHTWFNRNASRWFRKIATIYHAIEYNQSVGNKYTKFMWIDSDCVFTNTVTEEFVNELLFDSNTKDVCYLLGTERQVMETGLIGYNLELTGLKFLWHLIGYYSGNDFHNLIRWDDCYVTQKILFGNKQYKGYDIATTAGEYSEVFSNSLVKNHITHDKGRHGRKLGIMK